jgi:circadian clock protein KaiC
MKHPTSVLLVGGGLEPGTACLMYGTTGAGKSTLASLYLQAAAERGEHGLLLCFDERRDTFIRRCRSLGLKVPDLMEAGHIELRQVDAAAWHRGNSPIRCSSRSAGREPR